MLRAAAMRHANQQVSVRVRVTNQVIGRIDLVGRVATSVAPLANRAVLRAATEHAAAVAARSGARLTFSITTNGTLVDDGDAAFLEEHGFAVTVSLDGTREVHDALKRRCLFHWIDYPAPATERAILAARIPAIGDRLATQVVDFVARLRTLDLTKLPGVAETIDWAAALLALGAPALTPEVVDPTLGVLLKYEEDLRAVRGTQAAALVAEVAGEQA